MSKKAAARQSRRAEKQSRLDANKLCFLERAKNSLGPKLQVSPSSKGAPRVAPHIQRQLEDPIKTPKTNFSGSRFDTLVTWCNARADRNGNWSWGESRNWNDDEWSAIIQPALNSYEAMTWSEIDKCTSGSRHKMHHSHSIEDICKEAQSRWIELELQEFDSVFRFRLGGVRRLWGFIAQAHFHVIWWDRSHAIYPTEP